MSSVHPSSKGLRELAAFLDNCAADGIVVAPPLLVLFSAYSAGDKDQQRATSAAISKRLNAPLTVPKENWQDAQIRATFGDFTAEFDFKPAYVLEQVEEMRPVKVWQPPVLTAATPEAKP